jgi:hypothetical protein
LDPGSVRAEARDPERAGRAIAFFAFARGALVMARDAARERTAVRFEDLAAGSAVVRFGLAALRAVRFVVARPVARFEFARALPARRLR